MLRADAVIRARKSMGIGRQNKLMAAPRLHAGTDEPGAPSDGAFPIQSPWQVCLLSTSIRGQALYRAIIDSANPNKVERLERHFARHFDQLRDVVEDPDCAIYFLTSNREGRGSPAAEADRVLRLKIK